jgi:hypothetical protein
LDEHDVQAAEGLAHGLANGLLSSDLAGVRSDH